MALGGLLCTSLPLNHAKVCGSSEKEKKEGWRYLQGVQTRPVVILNSYFHGRRVDFSKTKKQKKIIIITGTFGSQFGQIF